MYANTIRDENDDAQNNAQTLTSVEVPFQLQQFNLHTNRPETLLPVNMSIYLDTHIKENLDGYYGTKAMADIENGHLVLISQTFAYYSKGWDKFFRSDAAKDIAIFKQVDGGMLFIAPQSALNNGLNGLGLSPSQFRRMEWDDVKSQEGKGNCGTGDDVIKAFNNSVYPEKRFFMGGHGIYPSEQVVLEGNKRAEGVIAGLSTFEYQKLLGFFCTIGTKFLFTDSCYSAGLHFLSHRPLQVESGQRPERSFPVLINCEEDDVSTGIPGPYRFFKEIDRVLNSTSNRSAATLDQIKSIETISLESSFVLMPGSQRAHLLTMSKNVEISGKSIQASGKDMYDLSADSEQRSKALLYSTLVPVYLKLNKLSQLRSMLPGHARHLIQKLSVSCNFEDFLRSLKNITSYAYTNKSYFIEKLELRSASSNAMEEPGYLSNVCLEFTTQRFKLTYKSGEVYYKYDSKDSAPTQITELGALLRMQTAFIRATPTSQVELTDGDEDEEMVCEAMRNEFWSVFEKPVRDIALNLRYASLVEIKNHLADLPPIELTGVLEFFIIQNNVAVVKWAIEKGADVNHRFAKTKTLLHYGVQMENYDFLGFLIQHGANLSAHLGSLLELAAIKGSMPLTNFLIDNADKQKLLGCLDSAVAYAEIHGHKDYIKWIIDRFPIYQAQVKLVQDNYEGLKQILPLLDKMEKEIVLGTAMSAKRFNMARLILDHGVDVNHLCTEFKRSPIYFAVDAVDLDFMDYLIDKGADPDVCDCFKQNVFMHALTVDLPKEGCEKVMNRLRIWNPRLTEEAAEAYLGK